MGQLLAANFASSMSMPHRSFASSEQPAEAMPEQQQMTRGCCNSIACTEQDASQAVQALAGMPRDTLLQKMRAHGELS